MNGEPEAEFTNEQLEQAFYHLTDILDRCLCPIMLLGETGRSIIKDNLLKGDAIYVGVKTADFTDSTYSTLETLSRNDDLTMNIDSFTQTPRGFMWKFKGIPISIKIIRGNYEFFNNPDYVYYMGEEYRIPNPFDKYYEERNNIE